jgi:DNA polymerase-3 subunit delta
MINRSELEKLALFCGPDGEITVGDAMTCIGDSGESTMDDVAFAAASGDGAGLWRALGRAYAEGASPIAVLRATLRHFDRLHFAAGLIAAGAAADDAMKALRPPIFFKREGMFRTQLRRWRRRDLELAMAALGEAEIGCKSTGLPAESISGQVLARIALRGRASDTAR